jgi:succinoglycan biosynthesis protein ExoA
MTKPRVDILTSTFNEESHLPRCLDAILGQDYPEELLRVILVDGGSTDGTVGIAEERASADPRLTVVADGVSRNLPAALNVGLKLCEGDLVAKVDGHGWPELDFVSRAAEAFETGGENLGCVGGRPVQEGETRFGEALARARGSRFGVGGSEYAGSAERADVETVQCGVYRRDVLEEVGDFDPTMNYGEDDELNWRVRKAGYRILLDTSIRFHYITRDSWKGAYRQYRNYGAARVRVARAHSGFLRPYHLAPSLALAGAGALALAATRSRRARSLLAAGGLAYGTAAAASAYRAAGSEPALAPRVAAAFTALHAGYAVGMLRGLGREALSR